MNDTKTDLKDILVFAIGNSGRNDDGLGWKFADLLGAEHTVDADIEYRYQLQVEDAELARNYVRVIFVDASHDNFSTGFEFKRCIPGRNYVFSSHAQSPETVLYLTDTLFNARPVAYSLAISGHDWGLGTSLSSIAQQNLHTAFDYFIYEALPAIVNEYTLQKQVH